MIVLVITRGEPNDEEWFRIGKQVRRGIKSSKNNPQGIDWKLYKVVIF